jgi:large subunit ribosomal protein L2
LNQPGQVASIEYDPNRSGFIALVEFSGGQRTYVLAPDGLVVGATVTASNDSVVPTAGNRAPLAVLPTGVELHDVELNPGQGGVLARSAGSAASVLAREDDGRYVHLRLPSGEVRRVLARCYASIGRMSNLLHSAVRIGKAGRMRHLGRRPIVRGKAMNPNSHPHGGGEGVNPIGLKYPKTRWGKHALGVRTRTNKRTQRMIVRRRAR